MSEDANKHDFSSALKRLQANRDSIAWADRRAIAALLRTSLAAGCRNQNAMELIHLLADDSKPEVRKEVADLLFLLPDNDFTILVAKLSEDSSSFVQKATARALDRRRKGRQESQRIRRGLDRIESSYASMEKSYGTKAARRARKIADEEFDILVGRTVHDMRGIINPLKADVFAMQESVNTGNLDLKMFKELVPKLSERLAYLERFIEDMRAYSQATPAPRRREWIADVVKDAISMVQDNLLSRGVDLTGITLKSELPKDMNAEVTRHQVQMAIFHLLKNAYESFDGISRDEKFIEIRVEPVNGDIAITVTDNGSGVRSCDLETFRTFVPGNTTKKNQGTGFGLATAYRYAVAHCGSLTLDSDEGIGTSITLRLPLEHEDDEDGIERTCD